MVHHRSPMSGISIHALREESDTAFVAVTTASLISIHALREESDQPLEDWDIDMAAFQSTLSVRRATGMLSKSSQVARFQSTLSVRRATHVWRLDSRKPLYFNPRSP